MIINLLAFCALLLLVLLAKNGSAQDAPFPFEILQFAETEALLQCRSNLESADQNGDMRLTRMEYGSFLDLQTNSVSEVNVSNIPFRLESVYLLTACWCDIVDPNDNQCCLGGNDHIPLDTTQSDIIDPYLNFLCVNVEASLASLQEIAETQTTMPEPTTASPSISPTASSPSTSPTVLPSSPPPSQGPSSQPSSVPTAFPSVSPSETPSSFPTNMPSAIPSAAPSQNPSTSPSSLPTNSPSAIPTATPSEVPTQKPSFLPTSRPTIFPSFTPSEATEPEDLNLLEPTVAPTVPLPSLCVNFQYVVRNQVGLDAQAIIDQDNNNVLRGLIAATRNITIEILNGTYPGEQRRQLGRVDEIVPSLRRQSSRVEAPQEELSQHDSVVSSDYPIPSTLPTSSLSQPALRGYPSRQQQQRNQQQRKLAYYTDILPVRIESVIDNPLCAGTESNPRIRCVIVGSTVCVVLEPEDDRDEVRSILVAGLREAVETGAFLQRIPMTDLSMNR